MNVFYIHDIKLNPNYKETTIDIQLQNPLIFQIEKNALNNLLIFENLDI